MKRIILLTLAVILTACSAQAPQVTVTSVVTVTSTPPPASTPTSTVHPQSLAIQEQIAQSDIYTLRSDGQIEMQTPDGVVILPDILVSKDGTMTVTHEGKEFEADPATIKIEGQTITFQSTDGKTWVWDGKTLQEEIAEIREFVPANTIEFTETLSNYDLKLAPEADPKAIYWDIAVSHLGDATSKSAGMEANRAIYEAIITDHPEWEGISHSWDYAVRTEFMREFLKRSGGRMIVTDMNWNKYEADFNKPVKFEVIEVEELPSDFRKLYADESGQLIYRNSVTSYEIDSTQADLVDNKNYIGKSIYFSWRWTPGEVVSDFFRQTIAQIAFRDRDSTLHRYELYTRGGVPKSGRFYADVFWTFIK